MFNLPYLNSIVLRLQHPPNVLLAHICLQAIIEVVPPFVKHALADQFEPRCKLQRLVLKHGLEIVLGDIARVAHFIGVDVQVDIGLDEEDVINCRLSVLCF